MAFLIPVLAAIGGAGGAAAGAFMVGSAALSAYGMYQQNKNAKKLAEASKPPPLAPPPQASKAPTRLPNAAGSAAGMVSGLGGNASTFLTGPSGIGTGLSLGRNSLLGQ